MDKQLPIYFDYMATTPVDPIVIEKMTMCLRENFGNSASDTHQYGWSAAAAISKARKQVADLINAKSQEIIWTSGATESDNLAITGAARFYQRQGKHIVTCKTEHNAVLDTCKSLESEGFEVTYLSPEEDGLISHEKLKEALRDDTILVSIMHVNNEIGVIQDIVKIGELTRSRGVLLHVDAAQSAGKIEIDVEKMPVDLMSFSAHKTYGPKGVGALYVRRKPRVRLQALIHGGGHEQGMRSGTIATHQIVGMGEAFAVAKENMEVEQKRIKSLRDKLWQDIKALPGIKLNGDMENRVAGNLNFSVSGVDGDSLILALKDLAISTTSACDSASMEPSHVLRSLGIPSDLAHSSIRISVGRFTTESDIEFASKTICEQIKRLRNMSPSQN